MFRDNPAYRFEKEINGVSIYTLEKETDYHTLRYIEALNWQTFASCGTTKESLAAIADKVLEYCNDDKPIKTLRTDIAALMNVLKYSLKYPADEHCAVRMGAILSFIEFEKDGNLVSEDPNKVDSFFIEKKVQLALSIPEAYAFFLSWGVLC